MSALSTIPNHYPTAYATEWGLKAQTSKSRLEGFVTPESYQGERFKLPLVDADSDPEEITERAGETIISDVTTENRWIATKGWQKAHLQDAWDDDLLGQISGPQSFLIPTMMNTFKRLKDKRILYTLTAPAVIGKDGDSTQVFDSNQVVDVNYVESGTAADSNMTLGKLRRTMQIHIDNEVAGQDRDGETPVVAMTSSQLMKLLQDPECTSADYNSIKALVNGELNSYMGFEFVILPPGTDYLAKDSNNVRTCLSWVKSGIRFTESPLMAKMSVRDDRSYALQVYHAIRHGGVRTEEKKVIKIFCDEDL